MKALVNAQFEKTYKVPHSKLQTNKHNFRNFWRMQHVDF